MPIFKISSNKAEQLPLKEEGFGSEAQLRDFFAENLEDLLGVKFLENESRTENGRIDTLGIDEDGNPVIIEYKWKENEEILTQALSYLAWLKRSKRYFELLAKSKLGSELEISWSEPRVILVAQGFSRRIKDAVQTVENVELKTYAVYQQNTLQIENEYNPRPERHFQVKKTTEGEALPFDLSYHLGQTSAEMSEIFLGLRDKILQLPNVEERVNQKSGITYRTTRSFTRLEFRGTWIQLLLLDGSYSEDETGLVVDVTTHGWGYRGKVKFTPESNSNEIFSLVEASYKSTL